VAQSTPSTSAQKAQRVSSSTQWRDPLPICTCGGQGDCNSRQRDGRPGTWAYDYLNLVPGWCFSDNVVVRYLCWTFLIRAKPPPVATTVWPWTRCPATFKTGCENPRLTRGQTLQPCRTSFSSVDPLLNLQDPPWSPLARCQLSQTRLVSSSHCCFDTRATFGPGCLPCQLLKSSSHPGYRFFEASFLRSCSSIDQGHPWRSPLTL
jgi:hypothetical protein